MMDFTFSRLNNFVPNGQFFENYSAMNDNFCIFAAE